MRTNQRYDKLRARLRKTRGKWATLRVAKNRNTAIANAWAMVKAPVWKGFEMQADPRSPKSTKILVRYTGSSKAKRRSTKRRAA